MKEHQASFSAMMAAYIRAYHAMHATPKIFDDFLAYRLIPQEIRELIEQGLTRDSSLMILSVLRRSLIRLLPMHL